MHDPKDRLQSRARVLRIDADEHTSIYGMRVIILIAAGYGFALELFIIHLKHCFARHLDSDGIGAKKYRGNIYAIVADGGVDVL